MRPIRTWLFLVLWLFASVAAASYEQGLDAYNEEDYSAAVAAWTSEDLAQDPRALFALGVMHMNGIGVEKAPATAVEYYRKAADLAFPSAQYNLGLAYFTGQGVEKNIEQARDWWDLAARQGHIVAQYNLGAILWGHTGVASDQAQAMQWFRIAKANGSDDAAEFLLTLFAPMYRDLDSESLANAQQARDKGATSSDIPLVDELGTYKLGLQALQGEQFDQAYGYFEPLARAGNAEAQYQIAQMYESGQYVEKSFDTAFEWYEKAAQKGQGDAQYRLGMYYMKESPEINEVLGFYWLQSAADNNSVEAAKVIESL